jgi:AcrR family transcriptional regulator
MTRTAGGTRAEQARATRQGIVDTAGRLFSERGYEGASLQDIADEMGLTKAAVYYHFPSKADILRAIVVPTFHTLNDLLDIAETKRSRTERMRVIVNGLVDMLVLHREALSILMANPPADTEHDDHTDMTAFDAMRQRAITLLYGENPSTDQRAALYLTIGVVTAVPALADLPTEELRETLTRACTRLLKTN